MCSVCRRRKSFAILLRRGSYDAMEELALYFACTQLIGFYGRHINFNVFKRPCCRLCQPNSRPGNLTTHLFAILLCSCEHRCRNLCFFEERRARNSLPFFSNQGKGIFCLHHVLCFPFLLQVLGNFSNASRWIV